MPRRKKTKIKLIQKKDLSTGSNIFGKLKLGESYSSLILGLIIVVVIGILFVMFARNSKDTSSTSKSEEQNENQMTSSTYTIQAGDSLWSISEKVYKSGYNWIEIAKTNNLENPGLIHSGNVLKLPEMQKQITNENVNHQTVTEKNISENNSINSNSYVVQKGDDLWDIAVRAYGDGFRYVEIAKANSLVNPSLIHSGNVLAIPR